MVSVLSKCIKCIISHLKMVNMFNEGNECVFPITLSLCVYGTGIESRVLCVLSEHCTAELHPQSIFFFYFETGSHKSCPGWPQT